MSKKTGGKNDNASETSAVTEGNSIAGNQSRFKKEVEETPQAMFLKFDNVGESKEGFIVGSKMIPGDKGAKKHFLMKIAGVEYILPNNYQLQNKLENLVKTKGGAIPAKGIEVYIEFTGTKAIEGQANEMKTYAVRTT